MVPHGFTGTFIFFYLLSVFKLLKSSFIFSKFKESMADESRFQKKTYQLLFVITLTLTPNCKFEWNTMDFWKPTILEIIQYACLKMFVFIQVSVSYSM